MKKNKIILTIVLLTICFGCSPTLKDLRKFAATENYPNDTYLDTVKNKKALIIVAHDDDDCGMCGTIAKLHNQGWTIYQYSLVVNKSEPGIKTHPSEIICNGNLPILPDRDYRNPIDTIKNQWMPVPKEYFDKIFKIEKVKIALIKEINDFNPSVIFTLDDEIGFYGHPDHVFISQLVLDLSKTGMIHPKRIYQFTYTPNMTKQILEIWLNERLKKWGFENSYIKAKSVYKVNGMPEPNTQINITNQAEIKMKYIRSYGEEVRKNVRKFMPYYEDFNANDYFNTFDREFFRVIKKD
jgi:LmbE family N-acetylglucosaminyl deacetylase